MSDSVKDTLEAMIAGTHVDAEIEESATDNVDEVETSDEVDVTGDSEDTDLYVETAEDDETTSSDDDSDEGTSDTEDDTQEEDSHETTETETEEESEESNVDGLENVQGTTEKVNYKEFYEKVALAKFTANGREVEGFKNPEDLIRAQQMLHGYSDKMKVFKEYKKFIKPLQERNLMSDPEKFSLAMSLIDGDTEAIKKVIKEKGIDPLELDLENIKYIPKNVLPSETQMIIEDVVTQAKDLGIEDKFYKVLIDDFKDQKSFQEFVEKPGVRRDLIQHLQDGTYDVVQNEIRAMEMLDAAGELDNMSMVDKYKLAIVRLNQKHEQQKPTPKTSVKPVVDKGAIEKERLEKERKEAEFKRKATEKEKQIAEQRKKAASVSKPKAAVKKVSEEVKPEALTGQEFRNYFKNMLM